ncbi:Neurotransmitter-gated ion-channel ligand-binding domain [Trinorchestia longiramus]|nr:Neurotransmitter-gated ion-channel ligand-binding domain [Trinorchestia longiramus]
MYLYFIHDYLSTYQTFSMDCYFRQTWLDKRLAFSDLDGPFTLSVSMLERLWKPDTYIHNGQHSHLHVITTPNKFIRLYQTGRILYSSSISHEAWLTGALDQSFLAQPLVVDIPRDGLAFMTGESLLRIVDAFKNGLAFMTRGLLLNFVDAFKNGVPFMTLGSLLKIVDAFNNGVPFMTLGSLLKIVDAFKNGLAFMTRGLLLNFVDAFKNGVPFTTLGLLLNFVDAFKNGVPFTTLGLLLKIVDAFKNDLAFMTQRLCQTCADDRCLPPVFCITSRIRSILLDSGCHGLHQTPPAVTASTRLLRLSRPPPDSSGCHGLHQTPPAVMILFSP